MPYCNILVKAILHWSRYGARSLLRKVKRKYLSDTEDDEPEQERNSMQQQRMDAVQAVRRRRIWLAQLVGFISSAAETREAIIALLPISAGRSSSSEEDQHQDNDDPEQWEAWTRSHIAEMRRRTDECASYDIAIAKERASFAWCEHCVRHTTQRYSTPLHVRDVQVH